MPPIRWDQTKLAFRHLHAGRAAPGLITRVMAQVGGWLLGAAGRGADLAADSRTRSSDATRLTAGRYDQCTSAGLAHNVRLQRYAPPAPVSAVIIPLERRR